MSSIRLQSNNGPFQKKTITPQWKTVFLDKISTTEIRPELEHYAEIPHQKFDFHFGNPVIFPDFLGNSGNLMENCVSALEIHANKSITLGKFHFLKNLFPFGNSMSSTGGYWTKTGMTNNRKTTSTILIL